MVCVCVFFVLEVFELFGDFKCFIECCIVFFWFVIEFIKGKLKFYMFFFILIVVIMKVNGEG